MVLNMKNYHFILLLILFSTTYSIGQIKASDSENIGDCAGAMNILNPGKYTLQFTGKGGLVNDIEKYPSLENIEESNSLWCSFVAPFNGQFSFEAKTESNSCKVVIFDNESNDLCGDIQKGIADIKRMMLKIDSKEFGLATEVSYNHHYPMNLIKGQNIMVLFLYEPKLRAKLELNVKYELLPEEASNHIVESKIVDQRTSLDEPSFKILIRDVETGDPIVADIVINGLRSISSFYTGSDFYFNVERSGKFMVRCDAQGYFFSDREEPVSAGSEHELVIWLEPIGSGKSVQLDEIEFAPGTSEFLPSSEPKLRRLKDFLALNASIHVEIQGHVQEKGVNSYSGQKISEARAKRVLKYLVDNGIDKKRLVSKGYGNTAPIYEDPKFAYEEQANRRVEIKIL